MKLLFIGGTGLLSSACSELAVARGHELFIISRGFSAKHPMPVGVTPIGVDVHEDKAVISRHLAGLHFDAVVDFIAYTPKDVQHHLDFVREHTNQYVFISTASGYHKPPTDYIVTESTPMDNPFWQYSRDKIACEQRLMHTFERESFPVTIVRPSLTYGPSQIPLCVGSWAHPWTLVDRIRHGLQAIVPGDGTSLWVLTWNADFAKGIIGLIGRTQAIGETFHITSDEVLTWNEIYLQVFTALDMPPRILHVPSDLIAAYWPHAHGSLLGDKIHSVVFDNSKIKRLVPDFKCEVLWAEGLRRAIAWHESHPEFQTIDHEFGDLMEKIAKEYGKSFPTN